MRRNTVQIPVLADLLQSGSPVIHPGPLLLRPSCPPRLERRQREAEESHGDGGLVEINAQEMPPQKRARGSVTNGNLKAAQSDIRTQDPKARFQW